MVNNHAELKNNLEQMLAFYDCPIIVQEFIDGREINLALVHQGGTSLWNYTEIDFSKFELSPIKILNYSSKWSPTSKDYRQTLSVNPQLSSQLRSRLLDAAEKTKMALGMNGYARIDFRVNHNEIPYVIDVNPNCDLGPTSGFALSADYNQISYPRLVENIIENAFATHGRREKSPIHQKAQQVDSCSLHNFFLSQIGWPYENKSSNSFR